MRAVQPLRNGSGRSAVTVRLSITVRMLIQWLAVAPLSRPYRGELSQLRATGACRHRPTKIELLFCGFFPDIERQRNTELITTLTPFASQGTSTGSTPSGCPTEYSRFDLISAMAASLRIIPRNAARYN